MSYLTPTTALGGALCALALSASPALADQFVEAADNAKIDCVLSRGELNRPTLGQRESEIGPGSVLVLVADSGSVGELAFEELVEDCGINFS